jgi:hypothetical protein
MPLRRQIVDNSIRISHCTNLHMWYISKGLELLLSLSAPKAQASFSISI